MFFVKYTISQVASCAKLKFAVEISINTIANLLFILSPNFFSLQPKVF